MRNNAEKSYLPMNKMLLELANKLEGKFKVAFSITGITLEQFELYAPDVIESFKKLAKTGCVEFLGETYSHSLAALQDKDIFKQQVHMHGERILGLFGHKPRVFRNTEMIYSDEIGELIAKMGYSAILTEGAKHILGWKSPNFMYVNAINPRLKVLMRNFKLSDDIVFRFSDTNWSEHPLTAEKFIRWLKQTDEKEEIINLFMNYRAFGQRQPKETGIFEFLKALSMEIVEKNTLQFVTPSEAVEELQPISWADEERDLSAWLGNGMQREAFEKLYALKAQVKKCENAELFKDWNYLQASDHFHYMSTKYSAHGYAQHSVNPFDSPYEAFINYMNVLSDFKIRLNAIVPENEVENEMAAMHKLVKEKEEKIRKLEADILRLQKAKKRTITPGKK